MTRRKHCLDCGKSISKNATRCHKCAAAARWADPEYRKQQTKTIREALMAHWKNDDYRKQQERARSDPKFHVETDRKRKAWLQDPSNIQFLSNTAKAQWTDPDYRSRVSRSVSKSIKAMWKDPHYRRKMIAAKRAWWKKRKKGDQTK